MEPLPILDHPVAFYHISTFTVRPSAKWVAYLLTLGSRVRLYRSILRRWGQTCSKLELGMESLSQSQPKIPQELETSGKTSCRCFYLASYSMPSISSIRLSFQRVRASLHSPHAVTHIFPSVVLLGWCYHKVCTPPRDSPSSPKSIAAPSSFAN